MYWRLIAIALFTITVCVGCTTEKPSRLVLGSDVWVGEPPGEQAQWSQSQQDVNSIRAISRSLAPATSEEGGPVIDVAQPETIPAHYVVEDGSVFPTFPVQVTVRPGASDATVDRNSLRVTAYKRIPFGWWPADITKKVQEYLITNECDQHLCGELSIDIDELDLSDEGTGKYRFGIQVADASGMEAWSEIVVEISK